MPVKVIHEDTDEPSRWSVHGLEKCVKCGQGTKYWWNGGTFTLCQTCATQVTFKWCYNFAIKEGYGPLPYPSQK